VRRNFTYGNVATFMIYAGLSVSTFCSSCSSTQQSAGWSPLLASSGDAGHNRDVVLSGRFRVLAADKVWPLLFEQAGPLITQRGGFC